MFSHMWLIKASQRRDTVTAFPEEEDKPTGLHPIPEHAACSILEIVQV